MGRLTAKTALITGGARGMGEAHVRRFVAEGANVYFTDMLREEGETLAAELGGASIFAEADASRESDWQRVAAAAEDAFGSINILVNNAGIFLSGAIDVMSEADYRKIIDVNQLSVFLGMKHLIPSLRRAGGGSIINISSTAGLVGSPNTVAYAASKFAIRGMTKVAAVELGGDRIRVNSVHPGAIKTPMFASVGARGQAFLSAAPLGRAADPNEVSDLVLFLASDESSYCTGAEFIIDGGLTAI